MSGPLSVDGHDETKRNDVAAVVVAVVDVVVLVKGGGVEGMTVEVGCDPCCRRRISGS